MLAIRETLQYLILMLQEGIPPKLANTHGIQGKKTRFVLIYVVSGVKRVKSVFYRSHSVIWKRNLNP
jgi:hypothetical protein